ncbi:MAG: hypothetical protein PHO51_06485 [Bacteroidales bacterium]|nr:hypothetical protein [Bacteroidales bacterium]MDD4618782.1 hypothetical protein [Bacteroidales bacterium]
MNNGISLALLRKMVIGKEMLEGAYGGVSHVSSVSKVSGVEDGKKLDNFKGSSLLQYDYDELLFLLKDNKMYPATKKNFNRLFPGKKGEVNSYVKQNEFSFANKNSVVELFNYLLLHK